MHAEFLAAKCDLMSSGHGLHLDRMMIRTDGDYPIVVDQAFVSRQLTCDRSSAIHITAMNRGRDGDQAGGIVVYGVRRMEPRRILFVNQVRIQSGFAEP
jgi:hypothetical protein